MKGLFYTLFLFALLNSRELKSQTYATLPFTETFENAWVNKDDIRDVPSVYWKDTPATGNNSWSRDDDGVSRGAWVANYGNYTPAGAYGSLHSARFHSGFTPSSNNFDLYVDFSSLAGDKSLYFWYINNSGTDNLKILISENGGTTFTSLTTIGVQSTWTLITVPLGALTSPNGIIRFQATGDWGGSDIGMDDVKVNSVCSIISANIISGATPLTVSFTDQSIGSPTSWKWDFNNDGVIDATTQNPVYTYTSAGNYSVKLIASKTGFNDTIIKTNYIRVKPVHYATLPFTEHFDSVWINLDNIRDVPSDNWMSNPATGDNSWSREDDGTSRGAWTYPSGTYYPAGGNNSLYSARFHSTRTTLTGDLDLFVNFASLAGDKVLYFWYINNWGYDSLEILLSTNGGVTFNHLALFGTKSNWTKIALDLGNLNSSLGVIRFKAHGDNVYSDIGIDEVYVGAPSTTPIVPEFQANPLSGMVPFRVKFTDQSTGDITSWKWDLNGDGITESTLQNPSYVYTDPGVYSVKLIGFKSGKTDSVVKTNFITIIPQAYAPVPFREGFDKNWENIDSVRDVPSGYFRNKPCSGNASWSRSDDLDRTWSAYNTSLMPGALYTQFSARFNSFGSNSQSGILDLFLDFSTQSGVQQLSFWYLNTLGTDKLEVYLSRDGGATFGTALQTLTTAEKWTKVTIDLGFIVVSKGVIRFKATGDGGSTNIGIDEIVVCDPLETPVSVNFQSDVSSGSKPLTVNFTDQSIGTPTFWQWDFDDDGVVDATNQNPSYTYTSSGVYTVKIVAGNADSKDSITWVNYITVPGYASLPFTENFENGWANRNALRDVPGYYFKNEPAIGNNSWSRSDDGISRTAWGGNGGGLYYPAGVNNSLHSARFHSSYTDFEGILDLFIDFSTLSGNKTLTFWYINTSGSDSLNVFLSTDGGVTDGTLLTRMKILPSWSKIMVDLGNVTTSTGVIRFKAGGNYDSSDIGIDDISIGTSGIEAVDAKFSSPVNGLVPFTVKFTDQSLGNPTAWKWDFNNDGKIDSASQNPSYIYTKVGKYSVALEVSKDGTVDKETKISYISVYNKVEADFNVNITEGFTPLTVNFTDKSTGDPYFWKWDFDNNGTTDAGTQNAVYSFKKPGNYSVKLVVQNPVSSDTITKSLLIHVKGKAALPYIESFDDDWKSYNAVRDVPSFNWVNSPAKAMYSWSREDDGVARGAWNSNDAAYSPAGADGSMHSARFHTYDFMNGYLSSFSLNVDFSTMPGNKTLSFYYINPGGSDKLDVYLSTDGGTSFGAALATQTISSGWTRVNVDLGEVTSANGVIKFQVSADLDDTDIGIDELSVQKTGITPVTAGFTSDVPGGIVPLRVKFTDQSSGSPTSWKWDFNNDGVVDSTTQNPSWIFTKTGIYTVRLISSNAGSVDTEFKTITVTDPVKAAFITDNTSGFAPLTVAFSDLSTGNPDSWSWDFNNDGVIDTTVQNPSHTYNAAGTYTVRLIVSKPYSSDTLTKTSCIVVSDRVVADFNADKTVAVVPATIRFSDLSSGNPTSWSWDFDNNGTVDATTKNVVYTFYKAGIYNISLTSAKAGSSDKEVKQNFITIIDPIVADFQADVVNGQAPLRVRFTDRSTGEPSFWSWDFNNDGVQDSTTRNPTFTFASGGTYTVVLTVSKLGFNDTETKTNYITVSPATGLASIGNMEKIVSLYPNPARTWVEMRLENFEKEKVRFEIIDLKGTTVSVLDLTGQKSHLFDFSGYARGIYYLKVYCKDQVLIKKLILQ